MKKELDGNGYWEKLGQGGRLLKKLFKMNFSMRIKLNEQQRLVQLLADLLAFGLSIQDSLHFLLKIEIKNKCSIQKMEQDLSEGRYVYQIFAHLQLSPIYIAQLSLADVHGDLSGTLGNIAKQLDMWQKQRKKLWKILLYPLTLFCILLSVVMGMNYFLLPQLRLTGQKGPAISFLRYMPIVTFALVILVVLGVASGKIYLRNKTALYQANLFVSVPLIGGYAQMYYTAFFALEWGKLLLQGLELKEIVEIMSGEGATRLMQEMANELRKGFEEGKSIADKIQEWPFLLKGFEQVIEQGEVKGILGKEMVFYAEQLSKNLLEKVQYFFNLFQPFLFLLIAILIISVYGSLLLPIYNEMERLI